MKAKQKTLHAVRNVFLVLLAIYCLAPLVLMFFNSVKNQTDFLTNPFGLPSTFKFQNYATAWIKGGYTQGYLNSLMVSCISIVFVVLFSGLASYTLAKMKFRGSNLVMTYFILSMSIPTCLFLVPLFFIFKSVGLMNSLPGLIVIYIAIYIPFNVVFLRSFFLGIPTSIIESASLDGCSELGTFWRIILPISKPAFFTVALLVFLWTWNEFFFANSFLTTASLKPVSTRFIAFKGTYSSDWTLISAAGMISIIPIMTAYLLFQRNFIEGLMSGSVKG